MKQIKFILTIIVNLICYSQVSGQIIPEWATSYSVNNPVSIEEHDMATDKIGNVYITGYTKDTSNSIYYTIVTLKYSSNGTLQWAQLYDSLSYFSKIAVDNSGNVYISGHWDDNLWTIKYNTSGVLQWSKPFPSSAPSTWAWDIIADDSSNVYITGLSNGNKMTTLKYDAIGNLKWSAMDSYPTMGLGPSYVTLDNSQNVYITSRGWDTIANTINCHTIKYNQTGVKKWSRDYYGNFIPGMAGPINIKYSTAGFIYLLAMSTNNNNGDGDYNVVKYDTLGNLMWTFPYSFTTYYDVPNDLEIDKVGNVYVTGNIWPTGGSIDSIATIKISDSGTLKWKKNYSAGYSNYDEACGIEIDSLGFIYVGGKSSDIYQNENYVTIKYDSLGNTIWVGRYHNATFSSDEAYSFCLDKNGNIFLSGTSREINTTGILTIKYSNTVGFEELSKESNILLTVHPNPFQTSLTIITNRSLVNAQLLLYDEFGKEVLKIDNINQENIFLQRNNLSDGIYFFRLLEKNQIIATGKVIAD